MALNYLFIFCQLSRKRPPLPGGDSAYERGGNARQKFWIKPLKETNLFLTPKSGHFKLWLHESSK